ncbi:unnamed protein product [Somion occarium]|uniref:WD40 repeat-like protein n=1 Tax=Somion occarium TaxID=3059160 RepID=A0ABP1DF49_9APHY
MLAVCTSSTLTLLDSPTIKRSPTVVSPTTTLDLPSVITWSPDNSFIFVSQGNTIHKLDPAGNHVGTIFETNHPVTAITCRDKGNTVIFSSQSEIVILETHSSKVVQKIDSHKSPIVSLSLSNDTTLLASTSTDSVLVHNLTLASHTVLRGLPSGEITTCTFHPHIRTRLLLAIDTQVAIYDTSRPSSHARIISVDKAKGHIVAITCSPFSKSLIAVACSGGTVGLVDLDKEKGLLRSLSLRAPLTTLAFSPEGASLYAGTENGKILVLDLRTLDKPPKTISISQGGESVVCMAVQRKLKSGQGPKPSTVKPLAPQDVNKTPIRRAAGASTEKKPPVPTKLKPASAISPPRSRTTSVTSASTKPRSTSATNLTLTPRPPIRTRTISSIGPTSPSTRAVSTPARPATVVGRASMTMKPSNSSESNTGRSLKATKSAADGKLDVSISAEDLLDLPKTRKENVNPKTDSRRTRTTSMTSRVSAGSGARQRTVSSTSRTSTSSRTASGKKPSIDPVSPIPPVPKLPAAFHEEQLTSIRFSESRSPSPDLFIPDNIPVTPLPKKNKGKAREMDAGLNILGLGTPEVRRWVEAGDEEKKEGRRVGFAEDSTAPVASSSGSRSDHNSPGSDDTGPQLQEAKIELTVQISPRRPLPQTKASSTWTAVPSPLRNSHTSHLNDGPSTAGQPGPSSNPAHDLLHTLIRDALYDFRRETKAEIIGLHLDLVRMGRSWRKEMKEAMEEWGEELKEIRDDNRRLREENERLRRGY